MDRFKLFYRLKKSDFYSKETKPWLLDFWGAKDFHELKFRILKDDFRPLRMAKTPPHSSLFETFDLTPATDEDIELLNSFNFPTKLLIKSEA